jgi:hypothetical protein
MVCGYSRWLSARLVPSRAAEDPVAGWWANLEALGGLPRLLAWDGGGRHALAARVAVRAAVSQRAMFLAAPDPARWLRRPGLPTVDGENLRRGGPVLARKRATQALDTPKAALLLYTNGWHGADHLTSTH